MVNTETWKELTLELAQHNVTLVAVSKLKPSDDILELYRLGQRDFGENYVQELSEKYSALPKDIRWHFIGHLQRNKVKYIASFVHLIHTVDSVELLEEINKQAAKHSRVVDVLLQMHVAEEETKFGLDEKEIISFLDVYKTLSERWSNIRICGLMGMATNTENERQVQMEFNRLHTFFTQLSKTVFDGKPYFNICSMGMSADYRIAVKEGSNLVRIGSALFGNR